MAVREQKISETSGRSAAGRLPDFFIIGAMKCGTTSMHQYLGLHPQIFMSRVKELDFFIEKKKWPLGESWYRSNFRTDAKAAGESSTSYAKFPAFAGVPEKMHRLAPRAKLIYLVRDPLERIVSHYVHALSGGFETRPFEQLFDKSPELHHYVACSRYFFQLEQYFPYYPREQFLVIDLDDLAGDRQGVLRRVFRFLAVDETFDHPEFSRVWHESSLKRMPGFFERLQLKIRGGPLGKPATGAPVTPPALDGPLREKLKNILKEDVRKLREWTGQGFPGWSL